MRISHLPKALVLSALLLPAMLPGVLTAAEAPSAVIAVDAQSFRCIREMTPVRHFFVDNVLGNLPATLAAANAPQGAVYPVGSVIQLVPTEAMVKREAGFSPAIAAATRQSSSGGSPWPAKSPRLAKPAKSGSCAM